MSHIPNISSSGRREWVAVLGAPYKGLLRVIRNWVAVQFSGAIEFRTCPAVVHRNHHYNHNHHQ